jgi:acyl-CoA thioester hydrolase
VAPTFNLYYPMFTRRFKIRHYECDALGHVNNAVYLQYLEQTAIEASAAAGFGLEWYAARGTVWVIRKMNIEYLQPAFGGEELEVTTWVSGFHRVRALREYEVRRVSSTRSGVLSGPDLPGADVLNEQGDAGATLRGRPDLIVRAQADWVYIDRETGRPTRIPEEALALFAPDGQSALPSHPPDPPMEGRVARVFRSRRRVQRYELDPMVHVNNAVYLNWLEQAVFDACAEAGWTWQRFLDSGVVIVQRRHEIEYFRPALRDDEIEIVSQVAGARRVTGTWQQDVYCVVRDGQVLDLPLHLARDYNQGAFLTLEGQPARMPADMVDALAPVGT